MKCVGKVKSQATPVRVWARSEHYKSVPLHAPQKPRLGAAYHVGHSIYTSIILVSGPESLEKTDSWCPESLFSGEVNWGKCSYSFGPQNLLFAQSERSSCKEETQCFSTVPDRAPNSFWRWRTVGLKMHTFSRNSSFRLNISQKQQGSCATAVGSAAAVLAGELLG